MEQKQIGTLDDFPENRGTRVQHDGIEFVVFNVDGELYGIQNVCPHKRLPLHVVGEKRYQSERLLKEESCTATAEQKCVDEDIRGGFDTEEPAIYCPWHFLRFDLTTGDNDATGMTIATYDIEVASDGTVWVNL